MPMANLLVQSPLAALCRDHPVSAGFLELIGDDRLEISGFVIGVVRLVVNLPAVILQPLCEMAHGAEQQNQFFLVVIGVAGLVVDLCHHDSVSFSVSVVECADGGGQLVAEYQNQIGHSGKRPPYLGQQSPMIATMWYEGYASGARLVQLEASRRSYS